MTDKKKMSVEEVLAACRVQDGGGRPAAPAASPEPGASQPAAPEQASPPAASKPAAGSAAPPATAKSSGPMSVADILAAARGQKPAAGPAPSKPAAAPKPEKPAAKPAAAAAKSPAAKPVASTGGAKDTASILAAARTTAKPGPVSKAEAAKREEPAGKPAKPKLEMPSMPAKPASAVPAAVPSAADRRGFFASLAGVLMGSALAVGFSTLAITNLLWVLGLARFMFPNILTEPPTKFKVGFPDALAPGQVETKFIPQYGVWVVRYEYDGQAQIYALRAVCTHLGCTPNWLDSEQKFKCPCHGSGFYKDGINFEGPAPRPLERYAIRVADDGQLEVDKSRKYQEELGQWRDSSSYVPV